MTITRCLSARSPDPRLRLLRPTGRGRSASRPGMPPRLLFLLAAKAGPPPRRGNARAAPLAAKSVSSSGRRPCRSPPHRLPGPCPRPSSFRDACRERKHFGPAMPAGLQAIGGRDGRHGQSCSLPPHTRAVAIVVTACLCFHTAATRCNLDRAANGARPRRRCRAADGKPASRLSLRIRQVWRFPRSRPDATGRTADSQMAAVEEPRPGAEQGG
jgi:hypothetical protein